MRGQIFFNRVDQLGNTDRLGEKWMPLDAEASFRSGFRHKGLQKDNPRSMQRRIGLNSCNDLAAIHFRHRNLSTESLRDHSRSSFVSVSKRTSNKANP